jgi:hypothetical protein
MARLIKFDGEIDAVFADMNVPQHPGAALLVSDHDEIIYRKCYGLADLQNRRPNTTDLFVNLRQFQGPPAIAAAGARPVTIDRRWGRRDERGPPICYFFQKKNGCGRTGLRTVQQRRRKTGDHPPSAEESRPSPHFEFFPKRAKLSPDRFRRHSRQKVD